MSHTQITILTLAAVLVFWALGAYNRLVALRGAITSAWAQLGEAQQRRGVALQALLGVLHEALPDEAFALEAARLAQARMQAAFDALQQRPLLGSATTEFAIADALLASALARLRALVDQHRDLRAQGDIAGPLRIVQETEQRIAFTRQLYNDAAQRYDEAARQFPTRLLVSLFGFAPTGRV